MTPKKVYDIATYPNTPDKAWFAVRAANGGVIPPDRLEEYFSDYRDVWAYWKNEIQRFHPVPLWENGAPGWRADYRQDPPSVGVRFHEGAPRGMVLVCAGGGFVWKADYEGPVVADRFYDEGFNVAVLDYRLNPYPGEISRADAIRAIRFLRYHAAEYNTLPDHIAIMGFSAGGSLTCHAATRFDAGDPSSPDPVERVSSRPDAAIPCYGSFSRAAWPAGGLSYDRERQKQLAQESPDCWVTPDCPPFYIWQCAGMDDPRNAMNLAGRLAVCGVPFELHLFPYGNHGTGLSDGQSLGGEASNDPHAAHWVEMCCEWLRIYGF